MAETFEEAYEELKRELMPKKECQTCECGEMRLARPPTIFGDFKKTPFRDGVFECVIFDPPHFARSTPPPWYNDPTDLGKWYGIPKTKAEVMSNLHYAQKEFQRLTKRLCLQWYDNYPRDMSLGQALVFFKDWKIIRKMQRVHGSKKKRKSKTWWVTMVRGSTPKVKK